jgi:hypothetical protein
MMSLGQKPKSGQESEFVVNFLATFYLTIIVLTGIFEIILHAQQWLNYCLFDVFASVTNGKKVLIVPRKTCRTCC